MCVRHSHTHFQVAHGLVRVIRLCLQTPELGLHLLQDAA